MIFRWEATRRRGCRKRNRRKHRGRGRRRWRGDLGGDEDDGAGNAGERGWSD